MALRREAAKRCPAPAMPASMRALVSRAICRKRSLSSSLADSTMSFMMAMSSSACDRIDLPRITR
eukprot:scaffold4659_cov352-Prasinococcus_capsulatus_cf.AAC.2